MASSTMAGVDLPPRRPSLSPLAYKREPSASSFLPTHRRPPLPLSRPRCRSLLAPSPSRNSGRPSSAVGTSSEPGVATIRLASSFSSPSTPPSSTRITGTTTTPTTRRSSPDLRPTLSTSRRRDRTIPSFRKTSCSSPLTPKIL